MSANHPKRPRLDSKPNNNYGHTNLTNYNLSNNSNNDVDDNEWGDDDEDDILCQAASQFDEEMLMQHIPIIPQNIQTSRPANSFNNRNPEKLFEKDRSHFHMTAEEAEELRKQIKSLKETNINLMEDNFQKNGEISTLRRKYDEFKKEKIQEKTDNYLKEKESRTIEAESKMKKEIDRLQTDLHLAKIELGKKSREIQDRSFSNSTMRASQRTTSKSFSNKRSQNIRNDITNFIPTQILSNISPPPPPPPEQERIPASPPPPPVEKLEKDIQTDPILNENLKEINNEYFPTKSSIWDEIKRHTISIVNLKWSLMKDHIIDIVYGSQKILSDMLIEPTVVPIDYFPTQFNILLFYWKQVIDELDIAYPNELKVPVIKKFDYIKWPHQFGPGLDVKEHDYIVEKLLFDHSVWSALQYLRQVLNLKYIIRFGTSYSMGMYEKFHFLALFKLIIWVDSLWGLLLIEEEEFTEDFTKCRQSFIDELTEWTVAIFQLDKKSKLSDELNKFFRETILNITSTITLLGYFDEQQLCYRFLEDIFQSTLESELFFNTQNLSNVVSIIGRLTHHEGIFKILCSDSKKEATCFAIFLGKKVHENISTGEMNVEKIEMFNKFLTALLLIKENGFKVASSFAEKENSTTYIDTPRTRDKAIPDPKKCILPKDDPLYFAICNNLEMTDEEEKEALNPCPLIPTRRWDELEFAEPDEEATLKHNAYYRAIAQQELDLTIAIKKETEMNINNLPGPFRTVTTKLEFSDSSKMTNSSGSDASKTADSEDTQDPSSFSASDDGCFISINSDRKIWLHPRQFEDPGEKKGLCQCRRSLISDTILAMESILKYWLNKTIPKKDERTIIEIEEDDDFKGSFAPFKFTKSEYKEEVFSILGEEAKNQKDFKWGSTLNEDEDVEKIDEESLNDYYYSPDQFFEEEDGLAKRRRRRRSSQNCRKTPEQEIFHRNLYNFLELLYWLFTSTKNIALIITSDGFRSFIDILNLYSSFKENMELGKHQQLMVKEMLECIGCKTQLEKVTNMEEYGNAIASQQTSDWINLEQKKPSDKLTFDQLDEMLDDLEINEQPQLHFSPNSPELFSNTAVVEDEEDRVQIESGSNNITIEGGLDSSAFLNNLLSVPNESEETLKYEDFDNENYFLQHYLDKSTDEEDEN